MLAHPWQRIGEVIRRLRDMDVIDMDKHNIYFGDTVFTKVMRSVIMRGTLELLKRQW